MGPSTITLQLASQNEAVTASHLRAEVSITASSAPVRVTLELMEPGSGPNWGH